MDYYVAFIAIIKSNHPDIKIKYHNTGSTFLLTWHFLLSVLCIWRSIKAQQIWSGYLKDMTHEGINFSVVVGMLVVIDSLIALIVKLFSYTHSITWTYAINNAKYCSDMHFTKGLIYVKYVCDGSLFCFSQIWKESIIISFQILRLRLGPGILN